MLSGATMEPLTCTPKRLPLHLVEEAAQIAVEANPANESLLGDLWAVHRVSITPQRIAVLTNNKWSPAPQVFSVGFMEQVSVGLANKIISVANEWSKHCNKSFALTKSNTADVRISLRAGGYWSYVGTDCKAIPLNEQNMNLEGFTLNTPDGEYLRVVCHEFGHFLGCPHEHSRRAIVEQLNRQAVIREFMRSQGWSKQEVIRQILTPIEESQLLQVPGFEVADEDSIMAASRTMASRFWAALASRRVTAPTWARSIRRRSPRRSSRRLPAA
jgi:hypothetical protein